MLAGTHLVVERKRLMLHMAGGKRVTEFGKFQMLQPVLNLTRGSIFGFLVSRNEKREKVTGRKQTIYRHSAIV